MIPKFDFPIPQSCTGPGAYHESIDHWAQYSLEKQQHGAYWTLVGDDAVAVADGGLCLDWEEEGRDEAVDIVDARCPRIIPQMVQITSWEEKKENLWEKEGGRVTEWVSRGKNRQSEKICILRMEGQKYIVEDLSVSSFTISFQLILIMNKS